MGFCTESARIMLIIFNFIFWLSGVCLLGVGIWFLVDPNIASYLEVVNFDLDNDALRYSSYILIAFGAFIFLVGFTGCCGAIRKSKCLIGFYLMFLVIIFAGELAAGIIVALYRSEVSDKVTDSLQKSIKEKYSFANESSITNSWDVIQKSLKCCGATGYTDFQGSEYSNRSTKAIPVSCCVFENEDDKEPTDKMRCMKLEPNFYHQKGCKEGLLDWVKSHSVILIGVGCGLAGLQIIGFIFAVCLCRSFHAEEK